MTRLHRWRAASISVSNCAPAASSRSSITPWPRCCASLRSSEVSTPVSSRSLHSAAAARCTHARSQSTSGSRGSSFPFIRAAFAAQGLLQAPLHSDEFTVRFLVDRRSSGHATSTQWFVERRSRRARGSCASRAPLHVHRVFARIRRALSRTKFRADDRRRGSAGDGRALSRRTSGALRVRHARGSCRVRQRASARVGRIIRFPGCNGERRAAEPARRRNRERFGSATGGSTATVVARDALAPGKRLDGPAIVEEYDCTTYVRAGWRLTPPSRRSN